ncbi:thiolase family protein [Mobilicoccus caccae]|uniref:Acetyl-CoA acetyltransferase n=1 Tax=Mobilicoccus caccae TaxID=1859295 RepID=A0ABQ6IU51_9MICO|nr:thiolase family protein [Mobilicoccus caccae]GMA40591.1 acetyl-CoA acetyltransferase [Mobilicoccus caccae]
MTLPPTTPVVIAARRTPVGTAGHALAAVDVASLVAPVLDALAADLTGLGLPVRLRENSTNGGEVGVAVGVEAEVDTEDVAGVAGVAVDDVILGNCLGPGGDVGRVAVLSSGLPISTPALTVDRQCGSGQEAIHLAADRVRAGAGLVLAGGAESASTAPWRLHRPRTATEPPRPYARAAFTPAEFGDPNMGPAAEEVASRHGITRERQDAYAVRSHDRTLRARDAGVFDREIVPVHGVTRDERPRRMNARTLARLRPAFAAGGTVTAGNSCGISDGAALVAVVPEHVRAELGVPGLAITHQVAVGTDPAVPGTAPVTAVRLLLERSGVTLEDVGLIETTEAFAAQTLACADLLGLDPFGADDDRWCPDGGAVALGHPWGASGALLLVRLFAGMTRPGGPELGIATCAIGGGQGLALLARRL